MKKVLFVLLALSLSLGFASCSDDTKSSSAGLIGKWALVEISSDVETDNAEITLAIKREIENDKDFKNRREEYREDGTVIINGQWNKYYTKGNKLYLGFYDKDTREWEYDESTYRVEGDKFTCYWDEASTYQSWYPQNKVYKAVYFLKFKRY